MGNERRKVYENIGDSIEIQIYDTKIEERPTLEELIKFLKAAAKEGATHVDLAFDQDYNSGTVDSMEIIPVKIEDEPEDISNRRIKELEQKKSWQEAARRQKYEELKAIYEPDN